MHSRCPGDHLREDFLTPLHLTQMAAADSWLDHEMTYDRYHALHSPAAQEITHIKPLDMHATAGASVPAPRSIRHGLCAGEGRDAHHRESELRS